MELLVGASLQNVAFPLTLLPPLVQIVCKLELARW